MAKSGNMRTDRDRKRGPIMARRFQAIETLISSNECCICRVAQAHRDSGRRYIALEFAGIFAGFGSDVTLVLSRLQYPGGFDETSRAICAPIMEKKAVTHSTGCTVHKVDKPGK